MLHTLVRFPSGTYPFAGVTKPLVCPKMFCLFGLMPYVPVNNFFDVFLG